MAPVLLTFAALWVGEARRPYWVGSNCDPEYAYLLNSLALAEGRSPTHLDDSAQGLFALHPGTTLHALGGGALRVWAAPGSGSVRAQTLGDPEGALRAINAALLAVHAGACLMLGACVLRLTRRAWIAVLAQSLHGLWPGVLVSLARVMPESLSLSLAMCFAAVVALYATRERQGARGAIVLGIITGLGLGTKLTFAPIGVGALLLLSGWNRRLVYAGSTAVTFALAVLPLWAHAPAAFRWVWGLLVNTGPHGTPVQGDMAVIPDAYISNIVTLLRLAPLAMTLLGLSAAAAVLARCTAAWRNMTGIERAQWRGMAALAGAGTLQVLLAAKYPRIRHLTPVMGLLGVNLALLALMLRDAVGARGRILARTCLAAVVLGATVHSVRGARAGAERSREIARSGSEVHAAGLRALDSGCTVVHLFCSSSPVAALAFGNEWAGRRFGVELRGLFPGQVLRVEFDAPDMWTRNPHYTAFGRTLHDDEVRALVAAGKLVFQGPRAFLPAEFAYDDIALGGSGGGYGEEGIFKARLK